MVAGAVTVLLWIYAPVLAGGATLSSALYEIVPGFIACLVVAVTVSLAGPPPQSVVETFEASEAERRAASAPAA